MSWIFGTIALSYPPPPIIDDSSWKSAAETFTVALRGGEGEGGVRKCNSAEFPIMAYLSDKYYTEYLKSISYNKMQL